MLVFARRRLLFRLGVIGVAGLAALLLWAARGRSPEGPTVENRSGQPIAVLSLTVAGQTSTFRDLRSGGEVTAPLAARGGDPFTLEGRLADGTRIMARGRMGESHHFLVLPGGEVKLRDRGRAEGTRRPGPAHRTWGKGAFARASCL